LTEVFSNTKLKKLSLVQGLKRALSNGLNKAETPLSTFSPEDWNRFSLRENEVDRQCPKY
jgi:hypothetical protein